MKHVFRFLMLGGLVALASVASIAWAQRPRGEAAAEPSSDLVTTMMAFDTNKDGKLEESEITDNRLKRLFARADSDNDKTVTPAELKALAAKEDTGDQGGGRGGPGGGPGGPGGGPPGGPGGPRMGPPGRVGEVLPMMIRQRMNLTASQETELNALQKEVDIKLDSILNDEQKQMLKQGPRGPGGPGGGPGGPGGGPPPGRPRRDDPE